MSFRIDPEHWSPTRDLQEEFRYLVKYFNPVDPGELDKAVTMVLQEARKSKAGGGPRPSSLVLQHCRRGGKTFMLHAIASRLAQMMYTQKQHVIFVSMNSTSKFLGKLEDAFQAILSRIAFEYTGRNLEESFDSFSEQFTDFDDVQKWVLQNNVILIVDELDVIPPETQGYQQMNRFLDALVDRKGSALVS